MKPKTKKRVYRAATLAALGAAAAIPLSAHAGGAPMGGQRPPQGKPIPAKPPK